MPLGSMTAACPLACGTGKAVMAAVGDSMVGGAPLMAVVPAAGEAARTETCISQPPNPCVLNTLYTRVLVVDCDNEVTAKCFLT